jgi:DNA-binding CsgD family transcriptional regulator
METTHAPAGTLDANFEFFEKDSEVFYLNLGQTHRFSELDVFYLDLLRDDLEAHPKALKAMEQNGIVDPVAQLKKWAICNFGDFDLKADMTEEGILIREHVHCSSRGCCAFEGIICQPILTDNGTITPREMQIIKLITRDMLDKQIADNLGICNATVAVHITHIEHKIGCHSKAGITAFAFQNHIV